MSMADSQIRCCRRGKPPRQGRRPFGVSSGASIRLSLTSIMVIGPPHRVRCRHEIVTAEHGIAGARGRLDGPGARAVEEQLCARRSCPAPPLVRQGSLRSVGPDSVCSVREVGARASDGRRSSPVPTCLEQTSACSAAIRSAVTTPARARQGVSTPCGPGRSILRTAGLCCASRVEAESVNQRDVHSPSPLTVPCTFAVHVAQKHTASDEYGSRRLMSRRP